MSSISIDIDTGTREVLNVDVTITEVAGSLNLRATAEWNTLTATADGPSPFIAALRATEKLLRKAGELWLVKYEDGTQGIEPKAFLQEITPADVN